MLERDKHSNAIINSDVNALNKYKQERELHRKINKLMAECGEVKQCLENVNARLDKIENQINVKT